MVVPFLNSISCPFGSTVVFALVSGHADFRRRLHVPACTTPAHATALTVDDASVSEHHESYSLFIDKWE